MSRLLFCGVLIFLFLNKGSDVFLEGPESDKWSKAAISLLENIGVLEVVLELSCSLDACVADLAHFDGVELVPFPLVEFFIEIDDELGVYEIEKGVSDITIVLSLEGNTL